MVQSCFSFAQPGAQVELQEQPVHRVSLLPMYRVMLHNDDHHEAGYVCMDYRHRDLAIRATS